MHSTVAIFLLSTLALVSAAPHFLVEDIEGDQYHLSPILSRQRRQQNPQLYGGGSANKDAQSLLIGLRNPNGSGGQLGYNHARGFGQQVSIDAMVPVWSNKNKYGESTLNLGGGITHQFGGPAGSHTMDKRVGLNFIHRF